MDKSVDELIRNIKDIKNKAIEKGIIRKEKPQKEILAKDINYDLPDSWKWIRLGDYSLKVTDYVASGSFATLKKNVNYYNTENYAIMVKTADFSNNFTKNLTYTDENSYKFLSNSNLFGGELILSNIGSIGKVFKVPYLKKPMTLASNTIMVKFTEDKLTDYMYYYFKSEYGQNALKSISSGTSMLKFNKTQLKTIPLPIPSLETQNKIVEVLDKAQELIDKRKEQIEALDELVKSRFIEMFGDPIKNKKNWETDTVDNLCESIYGGGTPSKSHSEYYDDGTIPWVSSKDMKTNTIKDSIIHINQTGVDNSSAKIIPINSVIMVIRSGILKHTLPVAINKVPITINQDLKAFITGSRINPIFLMFLFKTLEKDILFGVRSVTADNIEFNSLKKRNVIVPPLELQNQFEDFVKQTDKLKEDMEASLKELEDNFNSLMQRAFKGELFN